MNTKNSKNYLAFDFGCPSAEVRKEIGETGSNISYRSFFSFHYRLRKMMEAMTSPRPKEWTKPSENKKSSFEECQGVTNDGQYWYFTLNEGNKNQGLYKFDQDMKLEKTLRFPYLDLPKIEHVGDPGYSARKIFVPCQKPHGFLVIASDFLEPSTVSWHPAEEDLGDTHPWCAVNPWNGRLYTSKFNGQGYNEFDIEQKLYAYNIDDVEVGIGKIKREPNDDITLKVPSLRVQGGCFTEDGKLYLSTDAKPFPTQLQPHISWKPEYKAKVDQVIKLGASLEASITCYSAINGHYYGAIGIMRRGREEVEGITYWAKKEGGKDTHLHVVLLDNNITSRDGIFFKHYAAPK